MGYIQTPMQPVLNPSRPHDVRRHGPSSRVPPYGKTLHVAGSQDETSQLQ